MSVQQAAEMKVNSVYYTFPVTVAISTGGVLPGSALSIALLLHTTGLNATKLVKHALFSLLSCCKTSIVVYTSVLLATPKYFDCALSLTVAPSVD